MQRNNEECPKNYDKTRNSIGSKPSKDELNDDVPSLSGGRSSLISIPTNKLKFEEKDEKLSTMPIDQNFSHTTPVSRRKKKATKSINLHSSSSNPNFHKPIHFK